MTPLKWYIIKTIIASAIVLCVAVAHAEISEETAIQCILGEARSEYTRIGPPAFDAVASALRNRGTIKGVYGCKANLGKEAAFLRDKGYYRAAKQAWEASLNHDSVFGAQYWESTDFKTPYWAKSMTLTVTVGKHKFYKEQKGGTK